MIGHCNRCGYLRKWHAGEGLRCPNLKKGEWDDPMAPDLPPKPSRGGALHLPPLVPARRARGEYELANGRGQGVHLAKLGVAAGWKGEAWYWVTAAGEEHSALKLYLPPL